MSDDSMLVPLSFIDHTGTESVRTIACYILRGTFSPQQLDDFRSAVERVVDRWRVLAGAVEVVPIPQPGLRFCIRVPLEDNFPAKARVVTICDLRAQGRGGSSPRLSAYIDPSLLTFPETEAEGGISASIASTPLAPRHLFLSPNASSFMANLAKTGEPILNVHVTLLEGYTCIGISTPHGTFDAQGQGNIAHAINAELNGHAWTPPPSSVTNMLQATLDNWHEKPMTDSAPEAMDPLYSVPAMVSNVRQGFVPTRLDTIIAYLLRHGYEMLWERATGRTIYLDRATVSSIVTTTKAAVQKIVERGERRKEPSYASPSPSAISLSSVMSIQAAYSDEPPAEDRTVSMHVSMDMRPMLTEVDPAFKDYQFNSTTSCFQPLLPKNKLRHSTLAELALWHRKGLNATKNLPYLRAWAERVRELRGHPVPAARWNVDGWVNTNHSTSRFLDVDFGLPLAGYYFWWAPFMPDHVLVMNQMNGGMLMQDVLRPGRWNAVDQAYRKARAAASPSAVA
ncbi:hypothetical protein BKA62DRAFT_785979 [Auriculariales sp. MPI-PUGE-AT-0066]|nr:hypothetical protein BKA62DRAFT_785979 [Auriculariales sp. MPI-PUGE-AT-0066]